jgi:hypothetical protein
VSGGGEVFQAEQQLRREREELQERERQMQVAEVAAARMTAAASMQPAASPTQIAEQKLRREREELEERERQMQASQIAEQKLRLEREELERQQQVAQVTQSPPGKMEKWHSTGMGSRSPESTSDVDSEESRRQVRQSPAKSLSLPAHTAARATRIPQRATAAGGPRGPRRGGGDSSRLDRSARGRCCATQAAEDAREEREARRLAAIEEQRRSREVALAEKARAEREAQEKRVAGAAHKQSRKHTRHHRSTGGRCCCPARRTLPLSGRASQQPATAARPTMQASGVG